jgi:hypothetical protein
MLARIVTIDLLALNLPYSWFMPLAYRPDNFMAMMLFTCFKES